METSKSVASRVRKKIAARPGNVWKPDSFPGLPVPAVARELSRMAARGELRRVRKGVYRVPGQNIVQNDGYRWPLHPAKASAAYFLKMAGKPKRATWATPAGAPPAGVEGRVLTRRSPQRAKLSPEAGALLEFLRDRGEYANVSDAEVRKTVMLLLRDGKLWREIMPVYRTEPPRVRAILGALGQETGLSKNDLYRLRRSLNPLSRFSFGALSGLRYAEEWQAK